MRILLTHSSRFGHTENIIHRVAQRLEEHGFHPDVRPVSAVRSIAGYDAVVVGASVRYGFFAPAVRQLATRLADSALPSAFIGVNLAAAKPEKNTAETNPYVRKFFAKSPWKPDATVLLGGELNFDLYNRVDAAMLKPILKASGKPWGAGVKVEYTDWAAVEQFAADFAALLDGSTPRHPGE
ncbi:menaquinone-dependent protoporphyrinogen IX dehydrogenase [Trueperella pyogenes]|uniref:menaquinone-dependent protoporphyrinogen IX dehydrogenase n=1 Tax=Trueperella pyogenes TaxID=1661 RepID=UPI00345D8F42